MRTAAFRIAVAALPALLAFAIIPLLSTSPLWAGPATGSLTVKIKPKEAKQDGARWRVDGGAWQKGGKTVDNLDAGDHDVSFKDTTGWKTPKDKTVAIQAGNETATSGKYKPKNSPGTIMLPGNVPLELVWIPAGSFMMGHYENEDPSSSTEAPQHQVTFADGFWIGKYEVTQAQWAAVMGSNPATFTGNLNRPVETVSWNTVKTFINEVNDLGQGDVRLPSEAEWEYACRAGSLTRFYWGDDAGLTEVGNYAWYSGNSSSTTHPVGQKTANSFGLFDMAGNVWELCEDWYQGSYTGAPTDGSAWVSPVGITRVTRGNGWNNGAVDCRSARRDGYFPTSSGSNVGFRLVM